MAVPIAEALLQRVTNPHESKSSTKALKKQLDLKQA